MTAHLVTELLILASAAAAPAPQDCRAITDPAARLACYDARDSAPRAPNAMPEQPSAPAARRAPPAPAPGYSAVVPEGASSASIVRADPSGRVASVKPLRYGLFRIGLDDGRFFDTATNTQAPPTVGTDIRLRRTVMGTTFLDIKGRDPITVRLVRPGQ